MHSWCSPVGTMIPEDDCLKIFAALEIRVLGIQDTADWKLSEDDIDNALPEVEILRARYVSRSRGDTGRQLRRCVASTTKLRIASSKTCGGFTLVRGGQLADIR